ncbi:DUF3168 domain-containing protein [Paracoccus tibetensis]|uniref:DUF3168 domain-containing protein n=1 Tax=Paracoccus tibetensis TaxID=336292 RepID=A0A1G5BEE2_9RHOB|nr:DUF3168 domain-containing protein [Paracoccus tibetensis]SCX88497.1 Protein of unknown function [Paracoccus tibetensis]
MRAGRALRRAIIARIEVEVPDLENRVSDQAVAATPYPYCTLGPSNWTRQDADCIDGRIWSLQVDIWHSKAAKGAVEDLVDDVAAALEEWEVDGFAMHPFRVTLAQTLEDPSGDLHGVVQIEAMVEDA